MTVLTASAHHQRIHPPPFEWKRLAAFEDQSAADAVDDAEGGVHVGQAGEVDFLGGVQKQQGRQIERDKRDDRATIKRDVDGGQEEDGDELTAHDLRISYVATSTGFAETAHWVWEFVNFKTTAFAAPVAFRFPSRFFLRRYSRSKTSAGLSLPKISAGDIHR